MRGMSCPIRLLGEARLLCMSMSAQCRSCAESLDENSVGNLSITGATIPILQMRDR